MTIADQLTSLANTKAAIKTAIENKGVTVGTVPFDQYPSKISAITTGTGAVTVPDWVRPSDWLPITKPDGTSQKVIGLFAVFDSDTNYVAFSANSPYTVDWGDGSAPENYATNVQCQHKYTFASIDPATATAEGYRQVVITITPQAGQNLSSINFQKNHTDIGSTAWGKSFWLELYASTSHADVLGGLSNFMTGKTMIPMLKAVYILPCNTVVSNNMGSTMFRGQAESVEYVEISRPNVVITSSGPLQYCKTIKKFNLHPTISATDCSNLFYLCVNLIEAPEINTVNSTNFSNMFYGCYSLQKIPAYNTSNGTSFLNMFYGCTALTTIPQLDTSKGSNFSSMFYNCSTLESVPLLNTSVGSNFSLMFSGCQSLSEVPAFNTANASTLASMFASCASLTTVPAFNTNNVTSMGSMFQYCSALRKIPTFNTSKVTSFAYAFQNCISLDEIPAITFAANTATAFSNTFSGCRSLSSFKATGAVLSFDVSGCNLSAAALNELYTNLPTVTGKTVTVTGNWGAAASDITIATAKGWTVTR